MLHEWNLTTHQAETAEEALDILDSSEFQLIDLVITDRYLPDMDGIEFAQQIRKRNDPPPIILLSSIGDDTPKIYPGLFVSILTKPVKQQRLLKSIQFIQNSQGFHLHQEYPAVEGILSDSFAMAEGIKYVYVGNVPGLDAQNTYCPKCHELVIERKGYSVLQKNLVKGCC